MDYDLQQQLINQRRQKYAGQADFQAPEGGMVSGRYVAPNALQYLAAGLRSVGGMRGQAMAEKELGDLQNQRKGANQSAMANALRMMGGAPADEALPEGVQGPVRGPQAPDMRGAYAELMKSPDYAKAGFEGAMSMAQKQAEQQRAQAEQARVLNILQNSTPQQAIAAGVPPDVVKAYAEAPNIGRTKVARTAEVAGPNGEKLVQSFDDFGNSIGQPVPAYLAPVQVNRGDKIEFVSPTVGTSLPVGMSPSEKDASQRGWATVQQGAQRLTLDSTTGNGKAPPGYRFTQDGALEAIPGGPAAGKDGKKPLTESQAKGSLYLGQMRSATAELDKLKSSMPAAVAAAGSTFTNWAAPQNAQKVAQLQNQWAEAYLRAKTGAAATAGEVDLNKRTFFPVVGDSKTVIEQKARMRLQAERDMEPVAGPGAASAGGGATPRIRFDMQGNVIP